MSLCKRLVKPVSFFSSMVMPPNLMQFISIVTNMMLSRDQDPYISHKLDKVMRDAKFEIIHFERKDIYLGRQDPLWKEFWADVCTIFAGIERFIGPALNIPPDEYPQFVRDLGVHFQNMAVPEESKWSYGLCFAQKPK